jgi:hypothetical protein
MAKSFSGWLWRAVIVMAVLVLPLHHTHAGGAIAIGPCAAFGYAFDYPDIAEAQAVALAKCSQDSCEVAVTLKRACGAFAIDGTNACGAYGYAAAPSLGDAQNTALRKCHDFGGRECVIRTWACDARG